MESKVFVSYSRKDTATVKELVSQIDTALGINCWIDLKGIESSVEFRDVIIKAIDEAEIILFMLSENSMASSWAKKEILYAKDTKRIVTICLGEVRPQGWFKFEFAGVDYIRATNKDQFDKLISDLAKWLNIELDDLGKKKESDQGKQLYKLKIKSDFDCSIIIDEEIIGEAKAGKLFIHGLVPSEYVVQCIPNDHSLSIYESDINLDRDILIRPSFLPHSESILDLDKKDEMNEQHQLISNLADDVSHNAVIKKYAKAVKFCEKGELENAIPLYLDLVDANHPQSLVDFGIIQLFSFVYYNDIEAIEYFEKAIALGNKDAYLGKAIANMYYDEDLDEVPELLKKGYDESSPLSYFAHALFYAENDLNKGISLIETGLKKTNNSILKAYMCHEFGSCVDDSHIAYEYFSKSYGFFHFRDVIYSLADCFLNGEGVSQDYDHALDLYKECINYDIVEEDQSKTYYNIGMCYIKKNEPENCYNSILKACQLWENSDALFILAQCYELGFGTNVDKVKAFEYYKEGMELGNKDCFLSLSKCYLHGTGTEKNYQHAKEVAILSNDSSIQYEVLNYIAVTGDKDAIQFLCENLLGEGQPFENLKKKSEYEKMIHREEKKGIFSKIFSS